MLIKYFILFFGLLFISTILAHGPKEIDLEFNTETKILKISIAHNVRNPNEHYIDEVEVLLNDETVVVQTLSMQTNKDGLELIYIITDAKPGDTIEVKASCNKFGRKKGEIEVKKKVAKEEKSKDGSE